MIENPRSDELEAILLLASVSFKTKKYFSGTVIQLDGNFCVDPAPSEKKTDSHTSSMLYITNNVYLRWILEMNKDAIISFSMVGAAIDEHRMKRNIWQHKFVAGE